MSCINLVPLVVAQGRSKVTYQGGVTMNIWGRRGVILIVMNLRGGGGEYISDNDDHGNITDLSEWDGSSVENDPLGGG